MLLKFALFAGYGCIDRISSISRNCHYWSDTRREILSLAWYRVINTASMLGWCINNFGGGTELIFYFNW